ncbi:hypothetical protein CSUB01_10007 [Colletotrichum sublineola]|uniref:Uncharacterized protein n=1 Tax=Colletotrichum sublineola TaxID=1173701 RepID=A0A066XNS8_COLSU|nr:hypothetical protein CSUB01_10007 [Colletotrichum sublineola]
MAASRQPEKKKKKKNRAVPCQTQRVDKTRMAIKGLSQEEPASCGGFWTISATTNIKEEHNNVAVNRLALASQILGLVAVQWCRTEKESRYALHSLDMSGRHVPGGCFGSGPPLD